MSELLPQSSTEIPPWVLERIREVSGLVAQNPRLHRVEWVPVELSCENYIWASVISDAEVEAPYPAAFNIPRLDPVAHMTFGISTELNTAVTLMTSGTSTELNPAEFSIPASLTETATTRVHGLPALVFMQTSTVLDSTQVNLQHSQPQLVPAAATLSQGSSNLPRSISNDHVTVQIQQPEQAEVKTILATAISKVMVLINRTGGISIELLVGLIGAAYQSLYLNLSMSMPCRITRNVLVASNGLGFVLLLSGMLRRARNCCLANLITFFGIILAAAGTVFTMSIDIPGLFGWLISVACLFLVIIAIVY